MDLDSHWSSTAVSSRGTWQHCQPWHAAKCLQPWLSAGLQAKPPKTCSAWREKQAAMFWGRFRHSSDTCQIALRAPELEFYENLVGMAAGLLPPVGVFLGLSFCLWDKAQSALVWSANRLCAILQLTDQELQTCLSLLTDLRAKIHKTSVC